MKKTLLISAVTAAMMAAPALAAEPAFEAVGDTYEYGHFTVQAVALNANSEEFNKNADFSMYAIDDYTKEVPMADGYDANGVTSDNNTATMYLLTTANKALLLDLGNGAPATANHFAEDAENEEVLNTLNAEFKDLVYSLAGDRELEIAITHNNGDHIGYRDALANEAVKMYFPNIDYTDDIVEKYGDFSKTYDLDLFTPGELNIELDDGVVVETLLCDGHTDGSTIFIVDTPVVTYTYNEAGEAVDSSAEYLVVSGDAIGSGSSVYLSSVDEIRNLSKSIYPVYDKLASYTNYNDYLSEEEKTDANIHLEGGHGWQIWNRFGDMQMDLSYVECMKALLEKIPDADWVEDGYEGKTLEELLQEGYAVTKPADHPHYNTTIYYGSEMPKVAAITTMDSYLNEFVGLPVEAETEVN